MHDQWSVFFAQNKTVIFEYEPEAHEWLRQRASGNKNENKTKTDKRVWEIYAGDLHEMNSTKLVKTFKSLNCQSLHAIKASDFVVSVYIFLKFLSVCLILTEKLRIFLRPVYTGDFCCDFSGDFSPRNRSKNRR